MARVASDIAFTPIVKSLQARKGSRRAYAHMEANGSWRTDITPELEAFIAAWRSEGPRGAMATALRWGLVGLAAVVATIAGPHGSTVFARQPGTAASAPPISRSRSAANRAPSSLEPAQATRAAAANPAANATGTVPERSRAS